ncbi:hypothetical protein BpHYR1_030736 [Brachionus plicatilis]|uniref:Uncharacterized protein n=1 Tax=Brachionus plicatilis TaxID=10195 RepID=A0A3M7RIG7_BRAPC|nr:hypothetical protein BpHYR1_030736 [Brachionus plicatilis]
MVKNSSNIKPKSKGVKNFLILMCVNFDKKGIRYKIEFLIMFIYWGIFLSARKSNGCSWQNVIRGLVQSQKRNNDEKKFEKSAS